MTSESFVDGLMKLSPLRRRLRIESIHYSSGFLGGGVEDEPLDELPST